GRRRRKQWSILRTQPRRKKNCDSNRYEYAEGNGLQVLVSQRNYGCGGLLFGAVASLLALAPFPAGSIPALLRISSIRFHCSGEKSIRFFGTNTLFSTAPRTMT